MGEKNRKLRKQKVRKIGRLNEERKQDTKTEQRKKPRKMKRR